MGGKVIQRIFFVNKFLGGKKISQRPLRAVVDFFFRSARLKNEMRARFNVEFSETALGHVSQGNLKKMCRLGGLRWCVQIFFIFNPTWGDDPF